MPKTTSLPLSAAVPLLPAVGAARVHISLRATLLRLVLASALPLIALVVAASVAGVSQAVEAGRQRSALGAATTALTVDSFLETRRRLAEGVAQRPLVRLLDPTRCDPSLADILDVAPTIANISIINARGVIVCAGVPLPRPVPVPPDQVGQFMWALTSGKTVVSDPISGMLTGRRVSIVATPILDDEGLVQGLVAISVDVATLQSVLGRVDLPPGTSVRVTTANGIVVADTGRGGGVLPDDLADPGAAVTAAISGDLLYSTHILSGSGWRIAVGVPTAEAITPALRTLVPSLIGALLILLVTTMVTMRLSRRISDPMSRLCEVLQRQAAGDREARAEEDDGPYEVALVARHFNALMDERAATERVYMRTEKLRAVGQMASGVVHDLNQVLTVIAGYADLAQHTLAESTDQATEVVRGQLQLVIRAGLDGAEILRRLLSFTRQRSEDEPIEVVDLGQVVADIAQLTAPRWRDTAESEGRLIRLEAHVEGDVRVEGWGSQLREALSPPGSS